MKAITDLRIWVTGASSGIGADLSRELALRGNHVVISGRSGEKLNEVRKSCGDCVDVLPFDVARRDDNQRAAKWIREELGGLDIAVLNAGICEYVDLPEFDAAIVKRVMDVNFMGLVYGVEAALPLLREGKDPYLVGMSSTVAYTGLPRAEAYGSSKAAIRHLMQCLRADLSPEGIDVSVICPGFVKTPLTDRNDFPMPMRIPAGVATKKILKGMERRRAEIHFPGPFVYMLKCLAILPDFIQQPILVRMSPNRKRGEKT